MGECRLTRQTSRSCIPCREAMMLSHDLANPLEGILPVEVDDGLTVLRPLLGRRALERAGFPVWASAALRTRPRQRVRRARRGGHRCCTVLGQAHGHGEARGSHLGKGRRTRGGCGERRPDSRMRMQDLGCKNLKCKENITKIRDRPSDAHEIGPNPYKQFVQKAVVGPRHVPPASDGAPSCPAPAAPGETLSTLRAPPQRRVPTAPVWHSTLPNLPQNPESEKEPCRSSKIAAPQSSPKPPSSRVDREAPSPPTGCCSEGPAFPVRLLPRRRWTVRPSDCPFPFWAHCLKFEARTQVPPSHVSNHITNVGTSIVDKRQYQPRSGSEPPTRC